MTEPVNNYAQAVQDMESARMTANPAVINIVMARAQVHALLAVVDAVEHLIRAATGTYDAFKEHTP
jgi:hypothetical protein